ncbi:hypothetical protein ELH24_09770 [Rhizobium ruizarguesonis]|nr:hypothetical protein [Rhizobium ruizarguesonis]TBC98940.1 hypothetical protein ELH25_09710 [Rhizobium ruizarguesonis]TBD15793.1 hypothetical protein ELH24_09770 [Rhizobium ruizarguesonis]TBD27710.1 hypothetical protein ELH20_09055 [Rhizobium ruizarguesonis]TBE96807.1 hypothetical protein ELG98_09520 [Rhizobium ruizarguesonis]
MAYGKADFRRLKIILCETLTDDTGDPLSCLLHETPHSHGLLNLSFCGGEHEFHHVAEACNIANVITSIERILSLPRSNIACQEMAEVLLLRLDVLREYICTAIKRSESSHYSETEADRAIRRWAGFLKHPSNYVFAHSCFSDLEVSFDPPAIEIDCDFLASWDSLKIGERDQRKSELAHRLVIVRLPETGKIEAFFKSSADHLKHLIAANSKEGELAGAQATNRVTHLGLVAV